MTYNPEIQEIFRSRNYFPVKKIFYRKEFTIQQSWECLRLTKKNTDDYTTFVSVANRECEKIKLCELTLDIFKGLIFCKRTIKTKRS